MTTRRRILNKCKRFGNFCKARVQIQMIKLICRIWNDSSAHLKDFQLSKLLKRKQNFHQRLLEMNSTISLQMKREWRQCLSDLSTSFRTKLVMRCINILGQDPKQVKLCKINQSRNYQKRNLNQVLRGFLCRIKLGLNLKGERRLKKRLKIVLSNLKSLKRQNDKMSLKMGVDMKSFTNIIKQSLKEKTKVEMRLSTRKIRRNSSFTLKQIFQKDQ